MALSIFCHKGVSNKDLNTCYKQSNKEERKGQIRLLNKFHWLKMQVMFTFFAIAIWNIYFKKFFSSFQCLYIVRFEWDIVLSSSYDGSDKRGYTMWIFFYEKIYNRAGWNKHSGQKHWSKIQ